MRTRAMLLTAALMAAPPLPGRAQQADAPASPVRAFAGATLQVARPIGEFGDYVDVGFGVDGHFLLSLSRATALGLRVDGGFLNYGNETRSVPLSSTVGGRITVDLTTSNNILMLGAGPQIMLPDGSLRPYAFGTAGLAYFVTESSLRGNRAGDTFATTNNYDDLTFALQGGAGVYIPVRRGRTPISIDLGARYSRNGKARYLREGSIRDHPDGSISFTPIESDTDLVTFHLGVSAGLGGSREARR